jgi:hypothetical protein
MINYFQTLLSFSTSGSTRRAALPFPDHALFSGKQIKRRLVKELGVDSDSFNLAEHEGKQRGLQLARMPSKLLTR